MILIIIFLLVLIVVILANYLYKYFYQKKVKKIVELSILKDKIKKPFFISNKNLFNLKNKWTVKYLKEKFHN